MASCRTRRSEGFRGTFRVLVLLSTVFLSMKSVAAQPQLDLRQNSDGTWGFAVRGAGMASAEQPKPLQAERWDSAGRTVSEFRGGYTSLTKEEDDVVGVGTLSLGGDASLEFNDHWSFEKDILHLRRTVTVHGNGPDGFLSAATMQISEPQRWPQIEWFVPGMLYGGFDLIPDFAIGGRDYYQPGTYTVRIREDRMPAPLINGS